MITLILLAAAISACNAPQPEKVGILLLAHGGDESWNKEIHAAAAPVKKKYPLEVAFGMADPVTLQAGIDSLERGGIEKIVVVPLFISSFSPIIRQNEFLLKKRDKLADKPMVMDHSKGHGHNPHHSHHSDTRNPEEDSVKLIPVNFKSEIILTQPLNDHPLVAEILLERILELSQQPANETVILVAHGPNDDDDNKHWIETMNSIAAQIENLHQENNKPFRQIVPVTIRDDADSLIYAQAKEQLRALVSESGSDGDVIVVPLLLARGGIEKGIVARLEGLKYKWSGKTLLPHPGITEFIESTVNSALVAHSHD